MTTASSSIASSTASAVTQHPAENVIGSNHAELQQSLLTIGAKLHFEVDTHQYFIKATEQECISVSAFIETFTPQFKRLELAASLAERTGVPSEEFLEDWRIRRDLSIVRGTEFHLYVKTFLTSGRKKTLQTPITQEVQAFHQFWERNGKDFELVANEFPVFSQELMLAGTVDTLFYRPASKQYFIFDWKTNRNIRTQSQYHEKLKVPFAQLDVCELSKYSIQLALYAELLKRAINLDIAKTYVIHFMRTGAYKVIELQSLDAELMTQALAKLPAIRKQLLNLEA